MERSKKGKGAGARNKESDNNNGWFSGFGRCSCAGCGQHEARVRTTANGPPRKVIVGTVMQAFWGNIPGFKTVWTNWRVSWTRWPRRPERNTAAVSTSRCCRKRRSRVKRREMCWRRSVPFEGQVQDLFTREGREHGCYIVVPTYLLDSKEKKLCSNAALLVGRKGELVGTYRKIHLVVSLDRGNMEGGTTPGDALPVFDCDFGKLGIQICYDMEFDDGWTELARERRGIDRLAYPVPADLSARFPREGATLLHVSEHMAA